MEKIPEFCKFFIPETCSRGLLIPQDFIARLKRALPGEVFIRCQGANLLELVSVSKTKDGVFLTTGWEDFVRDNLIVPGEVMVFKFDGGNIFDFKRFARCGCLKKNVPAGVREQEESDECGCDEIGHQVHNQVEDREEMGRDNTVIILSDTEVSDSEVQEVQSHGDTEIVDSYDEIEIVHLEPETEVQTPVRTEIVQSETEVESADEVEIIQSEAEVLEVQDNFSGNRGGIHQVHPFFETKRKVQGWGRSALKQVIVVGPDGREWPRKAVRWVDGRLWILNWKSFCHWNKVQLDDKFICHLIEGRKGVVDRVQVEIVRAPAI